MRSMVFDIFTYDLKLPRYQSEVEDLHRWPDHEVGLQRSEVHIFELFQNRSSPTTFSDGHEREEKSQACNRKESAILGNFNHQLVETYCTVQR
jgi:hypothetical protein